MKKIILILVAVGYMSTMAFAQATSKASQGFAIGIKGGINISNVYDTKGQDFVAKAKVGAAIGAFASIPVWNIIAIQPEVLFSQKGFKGTGSLLGNNYSYTRTTDYIDVPLLLAVKPISALTILAGPQYSFLIKEKNVFESSLYSSTQEQQFNNDNIRKNTLCFLGGVDVSLGKMVIGARAGWDLQNNAGDGTNNTPRYKNVWYQATIGFKLL